MKLYEFINRLEKLKAENTFNWNSEVIIYDPDFRRPVSQVIKSENGKVVLRSE